MTTNETDEDGFYCYFSYFISSLTSLPLIMSLGPTGPAVREDTADSKAGYGSVLSETVCGDYEKSSSQQPVHQHSVERFRTVSNIFQ